jgi:hypothetical protein
MIQLLHISLGMAPQQLKQQQLESYVTPVATAMHGQGRTIRPMFKLPPMALQ